MRKLSSFPEVPAHIEYLVLIRNAKRTAPANPIDHKALLLAKHNEIVRSYDELQTATQGRTLAALLPNPSLSSVKESLLSCYTVRTVGVKRLKSAIAKIHGVRFLKYCPMCGVTSPTTHDHYLPSSKFPEFSVHPLNLIPCCSVCNSTKDDDWLDENDQRQYLHLYSDLIPIEDFLIVGLHMPPNTTGVGATFKLLRPDGFRLKDWRLIESHFKRLKLLARYTDQSNAEIAEILEACAEHLAAGGSKPRKFLTGIANRQKAIYGSSNWRVQLMRSLAASPKFRKLIDVATH